MARTAAFEAHHSRYDEWFERHAAAYYSELLAVRALLPWRGKGLSIGVGTGRFAAPLGVEVGIDPASQVLSYAAARRIVVAQAVAESLPFAPGCFDYGLIVTTICFVDDAAAMLSEAHRVLKPGGALITGFIDRDSELGRHYLAHQDENVFYRDATFYNAAEVERCLEDAGFSVVEWVQTLERPLHLSREIEPVREGRGRGAFVVVKAARP
ncbi:MAG TPA: class I SAM-dependent methyltransferase [Arenicellales bacterium]|nr:class I SAM-dependent methyltransferase [Arenicellales bacterium]